MRKTAKPKEKEKKKIKELRQGRRAK